jgi:hypothetical protein
MHPSHLPLHLAIKMPLPASPGSPACSACRAERWGAFVLCSCFSPLSLPALQVGGELTVDDHTSRAAYDAYFKGERQSDARSRYCENAIPPALGSQTNHLQLTKHSCLPLLLE